MSWRGDFWLSQVDIERVAATFSGQDHANHTDIIGMHAMRFAVAAALGV
jgi:hypothetical protein